MERLLLKNIWSINKMTKYLKSGTSSDRAGYRWKRGNGALSWWKHGRRLELPLWDDDDDPWSGKCLVAYKLLLVVQ